jgi:hypothetical protein
MGVDQVNQLSKHLHELMQKEFDQLNKEIGLEQKYYSADWTTLSPQQPAAASKRWKSEESTVSVANMSLDSNFSDEHQKLVDGRGPNTSDLNVSSSDSAVNDNDYSDYERVDAVMDNEESPAAAEDKKSN